MYGCRKGVFKHMIRKIGIVLSTFFLAWGALLPNVHAESDELQQIIENWSMQSTQIVKWVEDEKWIEAKEELSVLAKQFSKSNLSEKDWHVHDIQQLSTVILQLDRQLNQVSPHKEKVYLAAKQMEIAFDAISHPHQPLWQQFYQPLLNKIQNYQRAVQAKNQKKMKEIWMQISRDFELIRPGLVLSKSTYTVEKIDSLLYFIDQHPNPTSQVETVERLLILMRPLFFGSEKDVIAVVNPLEAISLELVVVTISFFILMILSYVSWRKYRSDHKEKIA